jgi:hypothetical protein
LRRRRRSIHGQIRPIGSRMTCCKWGIGAARRRRVGGGIPRPRGGRTRPGSRAARGGGDARGKGELKLLWRRIFLSQLTPCTRCRSICIQPRNLQRCRFGEGGSRRLQKYLQVCPICGICSGCFFWRKTANREVIMQFWQICRARDALRARLFPFSFVKLERLVSVQLRQTGPWANPLRFPTHRYVSRRCRPILSQRTGATNVPLQ